MWRLKGRQNWFPGEAANKSSGACGGKATLAWCWDWCCAGPGIKHRGPGPVMLSALSCRTLTTSLKQHLSCLVLLQRTDQPWPWFDVNLKDVSFAEGGDKPWSALYQRSCCHGLTLLAGTRPKQMKIQINVRRRETSSHNRKLETFCADFKSQS